MRSTVRDALREIARQDARDTQRSVTDRAPLVLVALSGGADSLALAAALAAEARAAGVRAGASIIDHGLQLGSAEVAEVAAEQARSLGLDPVIVRRVQVSSGPASETGGPEAAARVARYEALVTVATELHARWIMTAHTRDDQAEQVLLALARGSGTRSIAAIPPVRELGSGVWVMRPLLNQRTEVTRALTEASCGELDLMPWSDPQNLDRSFARVRVREDVLPLLEAQLGPGFGKALARSADLAREDADALDALAEEHLTTLEIQNADETGAAQIPISKLELLPEALLGRVIRLVAARMFGSQLTREHTLAIASLVTEWKGQGPIHAPRIFASRSGGFLSISAR